MCSGEAPTGSYWYDDYVNAEYEQHLEERAIKRGNPFYEQYYDARAGYNFFDRPYFYLTHDYYNYQDYQGPAPVSEGGPAGAPMDDDFVQSSPNMPLSTEHPWFLAIRQVCTGLHRAHPQVLMNVCNPCVASWSWCIKPDGNMYS